MSVASSPNVETPLPGAGNPDVGRDGISLSGRRFLIVTAPYGPFARDLAREIERQGGEAYRLILNMGDLTGWRRPGGLVFRGDFHTFAADIGNLLAPFTDVVLFGESSPYGRTVLAEARRKNCATWVLENGYFRPDWITLERNAANIEGRVPRHASAFDDVVAYEPRPTSVGRIVPYHAVHISLYYFVELMGRFAFPHFRPEFDPPPWRQAFGHIGRYIRTRLSGTRQKVRRILERPDPFFLVCLQRDGDSQLMRHSSLTTNVDFARVVLESFAAEAPGDCRLVFKGHPLDTGVVDLNHEIRKAAGVLGLQNRVDYLDGGNLAALSRASRGMVVNNSSAALSALGFGTPVKVLGRAFFDFDGLTHRGPLESFWRDPQPPDADLFARFRSWVLDNTQINGGFHGPKARAKTARALVRVFATRPEFGLEQPRP